METHLSALTSILDFTLSSKVATIQQIDAIAYKLKLRLFYKFTSTSTKFTHSMYL